MPARKTKTYTVVSGPNTDPKAAVPDNPIRLAIRIQNTGASAGQARFGGAPQLNGSDMLFAVGASEKWDQADTCPTEAVFVQSVAATTWSIMETVAGPG